MDYCPPCRRHLNGALACAGCGTPAEVLRRHAPSAPAAAYVYDLDEVSEPTGHGRARPEAPPRRRGARPHRARRRRGRKVLLGTVGLVLAAGTLSLAELARELPDGDGAATSVKEETPVETEEALEPTGADETPQGPDRVTEPAVSASSSVRPTGTGTGTGAGVGVGVGTGSGGKPTATGPAGGAPSASPSLSSDGDPSGSASPPPADDPAEPPPPTQPAPDPEPEPSPTETCNQFLWWCI